MDLRESAPVMVYDDRCGPCARFARLAWAASRGRITMIGHHTPDGESVRGLLGESALDMFWMIDGRRAYGGRAALLPLARAIIRGGPRREGAGGAACRDGACSVLARSASLLRNSKRIDLADESK